VVTILYLVKERRERRAAEALAPIMGGAVDLGDAPPHFEAGADEPAEPVGSRRGWLPPAAVLDRLAYRMIAFGFPIWTFGIITGAIWAESAWSRYWGWDPKETWSFITWVVFAGYLRAGDLGLEGAPSRGGRARRVRLAADRLLRREPVDRRSALLRRVT
jgi:ABC-type transport system involved in cytochrome c biogenesis permease subunit